MGSRIEDWLNLLDFRVAELDYFYYGWPFDYSALLGRMTWLNTVLNPKLPLGAYYIVSAQKQTGSRINNYSRWRSKAKVVGMPLANSRHTNSMKNDFSEYNGKDRDE